MPQSSSNFCHTPRFNRILVTGAAGFVGKHLVQELQDNGHDVYTTDVIPSTELPNYQPSELRDRDNLKALVREVNPDACIHLGAISFVPDGDIHPENLLTVNIAGTINLAEAIRSEAPSCRLLFVSTAQVYGPVTSVATAHIPVLEQTTCLPLSMYATSKIAAEHAVLAYGASYGLDVLIARPANHTGPGQSSKFVTVAFAKQMIDVKKGLSTEIRVGNLESIRDFTDVRDVVKAYRLIIERGHNGLAYNITTNNRVKIGELLSKLQSIVDVKANIVVDPDRFRPTDASLKLDIARLQTHTGWTPEYTLEQTLNDIVKNLQP